MNKAQETRKRNEQARRERQAREQQEAIATATALRQIRDNPDATPSDRLEAIRQLENLKKTFVTI